MSSTPSTPTCMYTYISLLCSLLVVQANGIALATETEKAYKLAGGTYTFGKGDTYLPGLHARTKFLADAWRKAKGKRFAKVETKEAVEEMLLRLRWDSRVPGVSKLVNNNNNNIQHNTTMLNQCCCCYRRENSL
eukprot:m.75040 g.75040  ORF g.75040 m.75040 type:complete len:134 (+) comp12488_c0_seq3:3682-4083(+)